MLQARVTASTYLFWTLSALITGGPISGHPPVKGVEVRTEPGSSSLSLPNRQPGVNTEPSGISSEMMSTVSQM